MGSKRADRIQEKLVGRQSAPKSRAAHKAELERCRRAKKKYHNDFKAFYREVLAPQVKNKRTGKARSDNLGMFHDYLIDFLNLAEQGVKTYSRLAKYLPPKGDDGMYRERWIYWRTLDGEPEIEDVLPDAPKGPLRTMFDKQFWQGLLIKIAGDGLTKCILAPRGHLKSTICTQDHTTWQIIRCSYERHMVLTLTSLLAESMVGAIKYYFEGNDRFSALYKDLGPPEKRDAVWNNTMIQCWSPEYKWRSCGNKEATLESYGLGTESTGRHFEFIKFDDIVGKTNYRGQPCREACAAIEQIYGVVDPGGSITDVGTRWNDDDPHRMFLDPEFSEIALDSSFLIATCLDGDSTVEAPKKLTPAGIGKPICPELFTVADLLKKRRGIKDDRFWYGQYFNQFIGTGLRTFSGEWIKRRYEGLPHEVAREMKLDIYIGFDTASGKREQQGKLDYTAGVALGLTQDRQKIYLLDAFKEKLAANLIAKAILRFAMKWKKIAAPGCTVISGFEENAYTNHLAPLLDAEARLSGIENVIAVRPLTHNNTSKFERVRKMAPSYGDGQWVWPHEVAVIPVAIDAKGGLAYEGEPYDVATRLEEEYLRFPGGGDAAGVDDLLDAMAYAFEQMPLRDFKPEVKQEVKAEPWGAYSRASAEPETGLSLGGYENGSWGMQL